MKPLRLELRGFTAFREPTVVDFEHRRLFVITGPTGAGKSSLLDAMIWALYGQVPRVGRSTRQLITHGESSMAVRFDFTARGEHYRVSRKAPTTVGTRLERLNEDGEWQPLADRARDVTAQVTSILGLDYSTFTRTVVLPQGAFDSFLRGDDSDRRAILTRLLGLDSYEAAGRAARARSGASKKLATALHDQVERLSLAAPGAAAALDRERSKLEAAIAGAEERRERVAALGRLARTSDEARTALDATRAACVEAETALAASTKAQAESERASAAAQEAAAALAAERELLGYDAERHGRLRELGAVLVQRDEAADAVEAAEQELAASEEREAAARAAADEQEQRSIAASKALAGAASALSTASDAADEVATPATVVEAARERLQRLETLAQQVESAAGEHAEGERALTQTQARSSKAGKSRERADAALAEAERDHVARREAFDGARMQQAAATLQRELQPGDPCPVCGEPVGEIPHGDFPDLDDAERAASGAAAALAEARTAAAGAAEAATAASATAAHAGEALETVAARRSALEAELAACGVEPAGAPQAAAALRSALQLHEQAAEDARVAAERALRTLEQLKGEQRAVAAASSARQRVAKTLAAVEKRFAAASKGEPDGGGDLSEALAESERRAERARALDAAIAKAEVALAEAAVRREERDRARDRLAADARERAVAVAAAEQAETVARTAFDAARAELAQEGLIDAAGVPDVGAVESLFRQLDAEAKQSAEALGGLRERIDRARSEAEEAIRLRAEVKQQERAASIAGALAQELHGDRFIAYVQEEALRVLAADASVRLHQLTNGRYQLVLEGSEFAVVDHFNGDERRSVKTLSGGETFLTSLALSLALSERLPELAGTGGAVSLESLFLDEGFGSLDAAALDVAIEGLEALADPSAEGRLVGVISHVPQLAERLEDRIEVQVGERTSVVLAS